MVKLNGKRRRGRPSICPGQPSVPTNVRLPESDFVALDRYAREQGVTLPDLIRAAPKVIGQLLDERDQLIAHLSIVATPEQKLTSFMRLLSAKGLDRTGSTVAAVMSFLERFPTDISAPLIRRTLEEFNRINDLSPGRLSDDDLWQILQHGEPWLRKNGLVR
jgi:hypothetical protein